jgi:hypothetical protein
MVPMLVILRPSIEPHDQLQVDVVVNYLSAQYQTTEGIDGTVREQFLRGGVLSDCLP